MTRQPLESPVEHDPLSRLERVLLTEGFRSMGDEEWQAFGERVYHRPEKILFINGETVFVMIDYPEPDERVIRRAVENIGNLFRARTSTQKAVSVFQATTVYVCLIATTETPQTARLSQYISTAGGAVIIPVVVVPEINQVAYPLLDEKVGTVRPRIEYLQYLLGERRATVDIHRNTIMTFWVSVGFLTVLAIIILLGAIF